MGTTKVWGFLQSVAAPTATSPHCRLLAAVLLGENIEPAAKVLGTVSSVREVCSHRDQARRASILVLSKAGMPEDGCSFSADPAELGWDDFSQHSAQESNGSSRARDLRTGPNLTCSRGYVANANGFPASP